MKREWSKRQNRKMKPVYLIVCEGESEETYVEFLRQSYRIPICVKTKILRDDISENKLKRWTSQLKLSRTDFIKTFLMYDLDVQSINQKIKAIDAVKLLSNPCIEIWYLLHVLDFRSEINSDNCIRKLLHSDQQWTDYQKPGLTGNQRSMSWENRLQAIKRAKNLSVYGNPSSTVYRLIEEFEKLKK